VNRLVDLTQLAAGAVVVEPALRVLEILAPDRMAASAHEPETHRGTSFGAGASLSSRTLFLTKLLFGFGWSRERAGRQALAALTGPQPRPAADANADPGDTREIVCLGDLLAVADLDGDSLSPRLRDRLTRAGALMVNLEGTIGSPGHELRPFQTLRGLRQLAGFTRRRNAGTWVSRVDPMRLAAFLEGLPPVAFNLANNHVLDDGNDGLLRTREAIDALGASAVGLRGDGDGGGRLVALGQDRSIGLVAVGFGHNHPLENEPNLRFKEVPYDLPWDELAAERQRLADQGARAFVVNLHWGYEHEHWPRPEQWRCVEELWRLGFDAIVGHHPHLVQPIVARRGHVAAFSLGDFIGGDRTIYNRFSAALSLQIGRAGDVAGVRAIPLVQTPYWAPRQRTMLLSEAPSLERRVWARLYASKIEPPLEGSFP